MRRTSEMAPCGSRAAVSLRPTPTCEPPFDDEREPAVWATAHQLALDWPRPASAAPPSHRPGPLSPPGSLSGWGAGVRVNGAAVGHLDGLRAAGWLGEGQAPAARLGPAAHHSVVAGASAEAKLAVRRFVRMCVEVLNGYRPPAHLRRLSRPSEAADVVAQALVGTRRVAEMRKQSSRRPPRRPPPVAVLRLRLCEPRPGAVEAAVAMVIGERGWAMALRLELHQEAWSATTLRLI